MRKINTLIDRIKNNLKGSPREEGVTSPAPLQHGLMISGNPSYVMRCLSDLLPSEKGGPQFFILPESIAALEPFTDIPNLPDLKPGSTSSQLTVSQVAMAIQRSITAIIDSSPLDADESDDLSLVLPVLAYASDAKGGDVFTSVEQFIEQMAELSNPEFLLQRIVNPLTVMPEIGSAVRLLQAYPGFRFSLIDHAMHNPDLRLAEKLKGKQLKMFNDLNISHANLIARIRPLLNEVVGHIPAVSHSDLTAGHRYKVTYDPDSESEFLMRLFGVTQTSEQWKNTHPSPVDLVILFDVEHISHIDQDLYALSHHLWNTRSRANSGLRLFVNWPKSWENRVQGKPMPLHGRILQGTNAFYGPENDVINAFRDVFGDRSPIQMNLHKDKTKAEIDLILEENDQKYAPLTVDKGDTAAGWIINRQLFVRPTK